MIVVAQLGLESSVVVLEAVVLMKYEFISVFHSTFSPPVYFCFALPLNWNHLF